MKKIFSYDEIQKKISQGFDLFPLKNNKTPAINTSDIDYEQFQNEILRMIQYTKNDLFIGNNYHSFFLYGPTGVGKCLAKGTKILMSNGELKKVEDIKIGEEIMGPDSKPRTITSTTFGKEMMYDIIPVKGEKYRVNESHILSLVMTDTNEIVNISVKDYLTKSATFKYRAKGYRVAIDFVENKLPETLTPYFLGLWLGDENKRWSSIPNLIKNEIEKLNLLNNRHIPNIYKINSKENRLQLLAGLLDSDGHYAHGGFEITQKNETLGKDILFLARSLGFGTSYKKVFNRSHKNHVGEYYKIFIFGDCSIIPTKIRRKKSVIRKQKKNPLRTGIKVVPYKVDEYFGFSLKEQDRRFVLGDFTVTHNTEITEKLAQQEECIYHKLEVQKVPIEILQGFPYLKEIQIPGTGKMMVAKLAPSTILPPPNDNRTWVLHFDEFNKADPDKMAAIMNLILTGELGGSADFDEGSGKSLKYHLPRKTIIIGTGNTRSQQNVENLNIVNQMDTATSERWHRTANLPYNGESWLSAYASKSFEFHGNKLDTRVPTILINYVLDKVLEDGKKDAPFIIPIISGSEEGAETERTTSPRAWTLVGDRMLIDMYYEFMNLSAKEKKIYEEKANSNYYDFKENNAFNVYVQNPENQIRHIVNQVYEFGLKGNQIIREIVSRYIFFAENRVLPEDIAMNYKSVREKIIKLKDRRGIILHLLLGVGYYLCAIEEEMSEKIIKLIAVNISTYLIDTKTSAEDIVAFIQTVDKSKKNFVRELHDLLFDINVIYKTAYSGYYYTSSKEIK